MNKAFLVGRLAQDPDMRSTSSGISRCNFSVAVDRRFTPQNGEKQTDFIPVVCWRQLADLCGRYLAKGRQVAVIGSIQVRSYDAKDGSKRYVTEVVADEVQFLDRAPQDGGRQASSPSSSPAAGNMPPESDGFVDIDDDELPF